MPLRPLVLLAFCAVLAAQPQLPCGSPPSPPYPAVEAPPTVRVWQGSDWKPPACAGWPASPAATLVATAGRFRDTGGVEALRRRVGAISKMAGLLYWSTTHQKWQPLIVEAHALTGPEGDARADFPAVDVAPGRSLYAEQADNLLGSAVYEMRIREASADRLVFSTENRSTLRFMGFPLFSAGEVQSICFLQRESKDAWRYYSISRMAKQASLLPGHEPSLINRAVAIYRYLAGIRPDLEPPAAR